MKFFCCLSNREELVQTDDVLVFEALVNRDFVFHVFDLRKNVVVETQFDLVKALF